MAQVETVKQYEKRMKRARKDEKAWVLDNVIAACSFIRGMSEKADFFLRDFTYASPCGNIFVLKLEKDINCGSVRLYSLHINDEEIDLSKHCQYGLIPSAEISSYGNWKIKAAAGMYFKREQLADILDSVPKDVVRWVRCGDLAATERDDNDDAAFTAGVLMGKRKDGTYIIADVINKQMSSSNVQSTVKLTAQMDRATYKRVHIRLPKDPGQAGKEQAESYIKFLSGFEVTAVAESDSKESRAEPMAAQWQAGNFYLVAGGWNEMFLLQLENFPTSKFKDMVDAAANGLAELEIQSAFNIRNLV